MNSTILLHEGDSELRKVFALHLEGSNWRVLQSKTATFAMQLLKKEDPDILISDYDPSDSLCETLFEHFREQSENPKQSILIITALERLKEAVLDRIDPEMVIYKPFDVRIVERKIDRLLQNR